MIVNLYTHYWQRKDSMVHHFNAKMIPDNFKANYIIAKTIVHSFWCEHKKEKNSSQDLVEANERDQR